MVLPLARFRVEGLEFRVALSITKASHGEEHATYNPAIIGTLRGVGGGGVGDYTSLNRPY